MGCHASKQSSLSGEIRSEELAKCAAVSGEVRWVWLRSRSLFTFGELRSLFKQFQAALRTSPLPQQQPGELQYQDLLGALQPAPVCSVEAVKGGAPSCGSSGSVMSKTQFLSLCESSDAFRLSEVVGAFGSRLFDVLDANGVGFLEFETFVLGLSKLLKVMCVHNLVGVFGKLFVGYPAFHPTKRDAPDVRRHLSCERPRVNMRNL